LLNYLEILKEIGKRVYSAVQPLLGYTESAKIVGLGFGGDNSRYIDFVAEDVIVQYLQRKNLSCTFIGEERGVQKIGKDPNFFLISDSIDGTTNAVRGIDFFSTSLAISPSNQLKEVEAGLVMNLYNGETYTAEKGKGAQYNGKEFKPSDKRSLDDAVLSINFSQTPKILKRIESIVKIAKSIRSFGAASLEMCYVASGIIEAYIDIRKKLRPTDIAAGTLILKEAGGIILQPNNSEFSVSLTEKNHLSVIAASNIDIYRNIVSLMKEKGSDEF
jgi:myo-inositol-1(or 4)-monophosphatase